MKISVKVHANSKKSQILKISENSLEIWLNAPALENKANSALIRIIAEYYGINKSSVKLVVGKRSKNKIFEIVSQV